MLQIASKSSSLKGALINGTFFCWKLSDRIKETYYAWC